MTNKEQFFENLEKITIYQWSKGKEKRRIKYNELNFSENSIFMIELEDKNGKRYNITLMFRNLPEEIKEEIFKIIYRYFETDGDIF